MLLIALDELLIAYPLFIKTKLKKVYKCLGKRLLLKVCDCLLKKHGKGTSQSQFNLFKGCHNSHNCYTNTFLVRKISKNIWVIQTLGPIDQFLALCLAIFINVNIYSCYRGKEEEQRFLKWLGLYISFDLCSQMHDHNNLSLHLECFAKVILYGNISH